MKKAIGFLLSVALLSACLTSCSVERVGSSNAEYFGYLSETDEAANIVLLNMPSSGRLAEDLIYNAVSEGNLPIFNITDVFFSNGELVSRFELTYSRYIDYLSLWENRIFALYTESGVSARGLQTLRDRLRQDLTGVRLLVGADAEAGFDGYMVEYGADLPDRDNLFLLTEGDTLAAAYALSCESEKVSGIICSERTGRMYGHRILENGAVDREQITASTLKYFGYYHTPGFSGSRTLYEDVAALNNSNLAFVETGSVEGARQLLEECAASGFKAIVYINFFFDWRADLHGNWQDIYAEYKVVFDEYRDDIFTFYIDEPKWNNLDETAFRTATKALREDYPDKRMLAVIAHPVLGTDCASYFEFCTDLGYDMYAVRSDAERKNQLLELDKIAAFNQDLWLVPWACAIGAATESILIEDLNKCYELGLRYDKIVGLLPFTYADSDIGTNLGDWGKGLMTYFNADSDQYMPDLLAEHLRIGRQICGISTD